MAWLQRNAKWGWLVGTATFVYGLPGAIDDGAVWWGWLGVTSSSMVPYIAVSCGIAVMVASGVAVRVRPSGPTPSRLDAKIKDVEQVAATETPLERLRKLRNRVLSIEAALDASGDGESTTVSHWEDDVRSELNDAFGHGAVVKFAGQPFREDIGFRPDDLSGVDKLKVRLFRSDYILGEILADGTTNPPTQASQRAIQLERLYAIGIGLKAFDAFPGRYGAYWFSIADKWAPEVIAALPERNLGPYQPLYNDPNAYTTEEDQAHVDGLVDRLMGPLREAYETRNG